MSHFYSRWFRHFYRNNIYKIIFPKNLITNTLQIFLLIIINADKNNTIIRQQISC